MASFFVVFFSLFLLLRFWRFFDDFAGTFLEVVSMIFLSLFGLKFGQIFKDF